MLLNLHLPSTLHHRISRQFTHIRRSQFVYLRRARVLFQQVRGGEMELEGVVCECQHLLRFVYCQYRNRLLTGGQGDVEAGPKEILEWIPLICEEEGVIR